MLTAGAITHFQSADLMAARIKNDYDKWGRVIRDKAIGID